MEEYFNFFGDDSKSEGYTIQWAIENMSYCLFIYYDKEIKSPKLIADELQGTEWTLCLYPRHGNNDKYVGIYLRRENDCCGMETIEVNYEVEILNKNGLFLEAKIKTDIFSKGDTWGFPEFATRDEVFATKREYFLPEETLIVQCTIYKKEAIPINPKPLYARTIIKNNHRHCIWQIEKFSTVKPGLRKKFKEDLLDFDLIYDEDMTRLVFIYFIARRDNVKYISMEISIIDSTGRKRNRRNNTFEEEFAQPGKFFSIYDFSNYLLKEKRILSEDVLSLLIEFTYYTVDHFGYNDVFGFQRNTGVGPYDGKEKSEKTVVLSDDLKSMFCDAILSDTEIRTSTKSFPAHKSILSARSPVFRKMFGNDMKEKNSEHVDIIDMEDDTVHRMLLYIYTDTLEDLQFVSALKLYAAADKYGILSLRSKCSTFLIDSLHPNRACLVLLAADYHHDDDLKSAVQSYILEHDEVFNVSEWKKLMDNNPKLAADIMYRKINPGSSYPCNA